MPPSIVLPGKIKISPEVEGVVGNEIELPNDYVPCMNKFVDQIGSGKEESGEFADVETIQAEARLVSEHIVLGRLVKILVIEVVKDKAENYYIRFHVQAVGLEKFQFLICGIAGNPGIDDFDFVLFLSTLVQVSLYDLRIHLTGARCAGKQQGIAKEEDTKPLFFLLDLSIDKPE
jgi:hypothetical protein